VSAFGSKEPQPRSFVTRTAKHSGTWRLKASSSIGSKSKCSSLLLAKWLGPATLGKTQALLSVGKISRLHSLIEAVSRKTYDRNSQRLPREFWSGASLGYLTSRSQTAQITHTNTISKVQRRLPSGPTVPPDSHGGPDEVEFRR
jgi:hypothetical protein